MRNAQAGLVLTLAATSIAADGNTTVDFSVTDADGRPLDREGLLTEGAVTTSFVLSYLDETASGESRQYQAYTTRSQTSPGTGLTVTQSATDSGGSYAELGPGLYRYTFGTNIAVAPANADKTHTLGVFASRTFDALRYVANQTSSFLPFAATAPSTLLDNVSNAACNTCHTRLEAHGGGRQGVETCVLCHTDSNSVDPDTNNTVDFQVMIHKIHMGAELPSVIGGAPYTIVGYQQQVHDFGEVEFPAQITSCENCHAGSQGDRWHTRFSAKACGSCHDDTFFEAGTPPLGKVAHTGGVHTDSECVVCHEDNSLSPMIERHANVLNSPARRDVVINLVAVENTGPSQAPEVVFNVTVDGQAIDMLVDGMDRLRVTIAGPNTDYAAFWTETIGSTAVPATPCLDPVVAPCLSIDGTNFRYHATTPIPDGAVGSYTASMEGRIADDPLAVPIVRHYALNPVLPFAVTDVAAVPRREIVTLEKCNSCHQELEAHGNNRRTPQYCAMCHNPSLSGEAEPAEGETVFGEALGFKDLIHGLHANLAYPDALSNCAHCHVDGSFELPLAAGLLPSVTQGGTCEASLIDDDDDDTLCTTVTPLERITPPTAAACVSCHSAPDTAAHAEVNTAPSSGDEACGTCHGPGKSFDITVAHAVAP